MYAPSCSPSSNLTTKASEAVSQWLGQTKKNKSTKLLELHHAIRIFHIIIGIQAIFNPRAMKALYKSFINCVGGRSICRCIRMFFPKFCTAIKHLRLINQLNNLYAKACSYAFRHTKQDCYFIA